MSEELKPSEFIMFPHDVWCNSSRRFPKNTKGTGCSCSKEDIKIKDTMSEELKSCPFCGLDSATESEGKFSDGSPWKYIECMNCGSSAELEWWNRRVTDGK